jgi:hypothetical protein
MARERLMNATKIRPGVYNYRDCMIDQNWDSESYGGWWQVTDLNDLGNGGDHFPTKRAAMAAIDADRRLL